MPEGVSTPRQPHPQTPNLQKVFVNPFLPSLGIGAATGACGVAYGGIAGVLIQTPHPALYSTLSGAQWFCAGTSYFYCRSALLAGPLSQDKGLHRIAASGIAGSCSGAVAAAFLPRGSMVTGSLMFGLLAAGCQAGLNATGGGASLSQLPARIRAGLVDLIPMKPLSDKEYEDLLLDKLVKVEVEISLLDDQIANLRAARDKQVQLQGMQSKDSPT